MTDTKESTAAEQTFENPLDIWRQFLTDSERQWNGFFKEVLGTDMASSAMNMWMESNITIQRMVADQMERLYETFNVPTHRDLLALGERMKTIEDALARIESAVGAREAATTRRTPPTRTKRPPVTANGAIRR